VEVCGIVTADSLAAGRKTTRLLQLIPDSWNEDGIFHELPVVGAVALAIEVSLADQFRRKRERSRNAIKHVFDDQHSLRTAKAAERGLRGLVRATNISSCFHCGNKVGVVAMEQGPRHDGLGEIKAPAAIGVELQLQGQDSAIVVKPRNKACEKRMPFA